MPTLLSHQSSGLNVSAALWALLFPLFIMLATAATPNALATDQRPNGAPRGKVSIAHERHDKTLSLPIFRTARWFGELAVRKGLRGVTLWLLAAAAIGAAVPRLWDAAVGQWGPVAP